MLADGAVTVVIKDAEGEVVMGFFAPRALAGNFGRARAKDFMDTTGEPYVWEIVKGAGK